MQTGFGAGNWTFQQSDFRLLCHFQEKGIRHFSAEDADRHDGLSRRRMKKTL